MPTSLYFQGFSNSFLTLPYDSTMQFGTGDYTIQWFQYLTSSNPYQRLFQHGHYDGFSSTVTIGTSLEYDTYTQNRAFYYWEPNANFVTTLTPDLYLNNWIHIAITRTSGTTRFFVNGNLVNKFINDNTNFSYGGPIQFIIGNESIKTDDSAYGGYLFGFCWTKGVSFYTTDSPFAVPSSLPAADSNTVLILTGDGFSGSLGSTITNNNVILAQTNIPPSFLPKPPEPNPTYDPRIRIEESLDRKKYPLTNTSQSGRIAALKNSTINTVRTTYGGGSGIYVKNETEKNSVNDALRRVRAGGYVVPPKVTHTFNR